MVGKGTSTGLMVRAASVAYARRAAALGRSNRASSARVLMVLVAEGESELLLGRDQIGAMVGLGLTGVDKALAELRGLGFIDRGGFRSDTRYRETIVNLGLIEELALKNGQLFTLDAPEIDSLTTVEAAPRDALAKIVRCLSTARQPLTAASIALKIDEDEDLVTRELRKAKGKTFVELCPTNKGEPYRWGLSMRMKRA